MTALWKWFSAGPVAPERVPTDTVIPLFRFDDTMPNRSLAFEYEMIFEEVLNAEKIAAALWELLERPGWRKLGARLRKNEKGNLEYHIPAHYTKERPPIAFSKVEHDFPLSDHPLSKIIPRSNGMLQAFDNIMPFREHLDLKNNMKYLEDWLYTDKPQLGLHVVTFSDATVVTLTWGHTLLDAMGRRALLDAWVAVLDGREDDVPEFMGYDTDPLDALGAPASSKSSGDCKEGEAPVIEDFVIKDKLLNGLGKFYFIFNYIWEVLFHPSESARVICMPGSYLTHLRKEAYDDLDTAPPDMLTYDTRSSTPFLSDGDILLAWTLRLLTASNPTLHSTTRPLLAMNVLGLRSVLSSSVYGYPVIFPKGKAYLHNCAGAIFTLFNRADDILTQPLGHVAARIRKDLTIQGTRAQVEAGQRLARETPQPLFGSGTMGLSAFSNWAKAKLFDVDFSSAILKEATAMPNSGNAKKRGKPVYIQPDTTTAKGFMLRGSANCVGVDHNGDVWFGLMLRSKFVRHLDKEVESLRTAAWFQERFGVVAREPAWLKRKDRGTFAPLGELK